MGVPLRSSSPPPFLRSVRTQTAKKGAGGEGDIDYAKKEGKVAGGTIRNIVVNYSHIYLYTTTIGIQIKRK